MIFIEICNLPFNFNYHLFKKKFEKIGEIQYMKILNINGNKRKSKKKAVIIYKLSKNAVIAYKRFNRTYFMGRIIYIHLKTEKIEENVTHIINNFENLSLKLN